VADGPVGLQPQLWFHAEALAQHPESSGPGGWQVEAALSPQEWTWSRALPVPLARRYRRSRGLLRQHLARLLACEPAAVPLHSPPGAPPQLAAGAGWVSLSHSQQALLLAWSPLPIGVDLEADTRPLAAAALLRRFFPAVEQAQLQHLPPPQLRQAVLRSWVHKEAAIKARQCTLAEELSHWWFDHQRGQLQHLGEGAGLACSSGLWGGWRWAAAGPGCAQVCFWPQDSRAAGP